MWHNVWFLPFIFLKRLHDHRWKNSFLMLLTLSVPHEGCLKELRSNEKIKLILNVHISKCTDLCACVQTVIQIKKPLLPSCISKPWWNRLLFRRPGLMTFLSGLLLCRKFVVLIHHLEVALGCIFRVWHSHEKKSCVNSRSSADQAISDCSQVIKWTVQFM